MSVSVGVLAGGANPAAARAAGEPAVHLAEEAAALADYPVYGPARALGRAAHVTTQQA